MDLGLRDRVYLVTGGSRGLGFAAAQALVADGARVLLSAPHEATASSAAARLAQDAAADVAAWTIADQRGLLHAEKQVSSGRRELRLYQVTEAGRAVCLEWLRKPVVPETVGADLGQHLMRFSLMENYLERAEVIAFLADLGDALDGFVRGMEQFIVSRQGTLREHALLALEHGIAIHRASLEWVRSAMAALGA